VQVERSNVDAWKNAKGNIPNKHWMSLLLRKGKSGTEETKSGITEDCNQFKGIPPDDVTFSEEQDGPSRVETTTDDESSNERVKTAEDKQSRLRGGMIESRGDYRGVPKGAATGSPLWDGQFFP
jgi:hypothetical protein